LWRVAWEAAAEHATNGYAAELADYVEENPPPTFKRFLIERKLP
jgi:hypothetical protein